MSSQGAALIRLLFVYFAVIGNEMSVLNIKIFRSFEVVGRDSKTQLQMVKI